MEDLVGRYSNNSQQGEILARVLFQARKSVQRDNQSPRGHSASHKILQRLDAEVITRLIQSYEAGRSTTQLRSEFGLSQGSVVKLLQQHGVETRFHGLTDAETEAARELYESGLALAKVGEKLDRAPSSVRKALIRVGVVMRPKGGSYH